MAMKRSALQSNHSSPFAYSPGRRFWPKESAGGMQLPQAWLQLQDTESWGPRCCRRGCLDAGSGGCQVPGIANVLNVIRSHGFLGSKNPGTCSQAVLGVCSQRMTFISTPGLKVLLLPVCTSPWKLQMSNASRYKVCLQRSQPSRNAVCKPY